MDENQKHRLFSTALAMSLVGSIGLSSCSPSENDRAVEVVYGPPVFENNQADEVLSNISEQAANEEGTESDANENSEDNGASASVDDDSTTKTSASELPQLVYGPPKW